MQINSVILLNLCITCGQIIDLCIITNFNAIVGSQILLLPSYVYGRFNTTLIGGFPNALR